jgi:hypothetical protein
MHVGRVSRIRARQFGIVIGELILDMLTTHKPKGMTEKYFVQMIVNSGPAMRAAQRRISAAIVKRLGVTL